MASSGVFRGMMLASFAVDSVTGVKKNTYNYDGVMQTQDSSGQQTKSCFITKDDCDKLLVNEPNSTACDLTLYIVWSGTDKDGKALQSQAYRFSQFPVQELEDRISQLVPTFGLTKDDFTVGGDTATDAPTTGGGADAARQKTRFAQTLIDINADQQARISAMGDVSGK
jgi:hypothetical protein